MPGEKFRLIATGHPTGLPSCPRNPPRTRDRRNPESTGELFPKDQT